jgi:dehydrogenase/reductase SDR family member 1
MAYQPETKPLTGKVAIVTGASRGIGRGIAVALGESGAKVYVTGRTVEGTGSSLPGSIQRTAEEVTQHGGEGVALACDHTDDAQIASLFARVHEECGQLDILVNNAFATGGAADESLFKPFWELDQSVWDAMIGTGLRAAYVAAAHAARMMITRHTGLIVNISSFGAVRYHFNLPYHIGKTGADRMVKDMGYELRPHGVAAISLWPGLVLTDTVASVGGFSESQRRKADTPMFIGRLVAALAADPGTIHKSGMAFAGFELGREFGIDDPLTDENLLIGTTA